MLRTSSTASSALHEHVRTVGRAKQRADYIRDVLTGIFEQRFRGELDFCRIDLVRAKRRRIATTSNKRRNRDNDRHQS